MMPPGMPPMMPPMYFPPPKPPRGFARAVFTTLATTVLAFSLGLNFYYLAMEGLLSGRGTQSVTVTTGNSKEKIAVVPVRGLVAQNLVSQVEQFVVRAEQDNDVKAVILEIDTPGGSVWAADAIYHRLLQLKSRRNVPLAVSMGGLATSGGYYIACAADHLVATPTTLTGNIGVIMPRFNVSAMTERWGITENTLTAPRSGYKNAGSPFRKPDEKDNAYLQGLIDHAYREFTGVVSQGRGKKVNIATVADGRVFTGRDAHAAGLVDDVGHLETAVRWVSQQAGLKSPMVIRYRPPPTLLGALGGAEGADGAAQLNINGVKFQLSGHLLDELSSPRLLYLWRGQ